MCWFSGSKKLSKYRRIARKDVLVRKLVRVSENPNKVVSYFTEFEYELGKTYYDEELSILNGYGSCHYAGIFVGFNSYSTECKITRKEQTTVSGDKKKDEIEVYSPDGGDLVEYYELDNLLMIDCVIPKGATYYVNELGEYVSESIKPIRIIDAEEKMS